MQLNQQAPEKQISAETPSVETTIEVHSYWLTIQGEGPYSGMPAVFLRLSGCNLQCPLCDTEYTDKRRSMNALLLDDQLSKTAKDITKLVVITGGEPFRQDIRFLVRHLVSTGWIVQIETNGSLWLEDDIWYSSAVTIVCSPKTAKIHPRIYQAARAFKYVMGAGFVSLEDGLPTTVLGYNCAPCRPPGALKMQCAVYLQPVDEDNPHRNSLNTDAVVASCMKYGYRLCLQTHKLVGLP